MLSGLAVILICSNLLTFIIGITLNTLIIYLSFKIHTSEVKNLRWSIALIAGAEIAESIVLTALQGGLVKENGIPSIILFGVVVNFPKFIALYFWEAFLVIFVFRLLTLPVSFLYRYSIICGKTRLRNFFTYRYLAVLICSFFSLSLLISASAVPPIDLQKAKLTNEAFRGTGEIFVMNFLLEFLWCVEFFCAICCILFAIAYAIIGYTTMSIYKVINTNAVSTRTKALQRQLTHMMLLQAISPLILMLAPLLAFILMFIMRVELGDYASLSVSLLHWQPCIHPLLTLWFVKPFHEKIASRLLNRPTSTVIPIKFMSQANSIAPVIACSTKDACKGSQIK